MIRIVRLLACSAAGAPVALSAVPAQAITCHGNFQVVAGSEISTPYCRDTNLVRIARRSGFKTTEHEMLYNPSAKRELCRYIKSDIEAQVACAEVENDSGGGK